MDTVFALFCIFLAFVAGFAASIVWQMQVKRTALSIVRDQAGEKGRHAQKEQESELMALISEASLLFKAANENNEDMKQAAARIVPQLIMKYPATVAKHGKKLLKMISDSGGLEGLEDLF